MSTNNDRQNAGTGISGSSHSQVPSTGQTLQLSRIVSVFVQVRNLDRSLSFYRDILGSKSRRTTATWRYSAAAATPRTPSSCGRSATARHRLAEVGVTHIGWRVPDPAGLDAAEALLAGRAVPHKRQRGTELPSS